MRTRHNDFQDYFVVVGAIRSNLSMSLVGVKNRRVFFGTLKCQIQSSYRYEYPNSRKRKAIGGCA